MDVENEKGRRNGGTVRIMDVEEGEGRVDGCEWKRKKGQNEHMWRRRKQGQTVDECGWERKEVDERRNYGGAGAEEDERTE